MKTTPSSILFVYLYPWANNVVGRLTAVLHGAVVSSLDFDSSGSALSGTLESSNFAAHLRNKECKHFGRMSLKEID